MPTVYCSECDLYQTSQLHDDILCPRCGAELEHFDMMEIDDLVAKPRTKNLSYNDTYGKANNG